MKLYHASTTIVEKPDIAHSRDKLDFGIGFYLTQIKQQAINYAQRFLIRGIDAYLNEYCLDDNLDKYIIKTFANYDEEWLDYVTLSRKGKKVSQHYDIVSGGIANDKVFSVLRHCHSMASGGNFGSERITAKVLET